MPIQETLEFESEKFQLQKRNVELRKFSKSKDFLGPIAVGAIGIAIEAKVTGLFDGITSIEQMGAGLPDDASPSTELLDNPGEVARGVGLVVEQVVDSIVGDASTTAAVITTDAIGYHAGMVQAETVAQEIGQTAAEKLFFSPKQLSPECEQNLRVDKLSCDVCKAGIKQSSYSHCCVCDDDNFDVCQKCHDSHVTCKGNDRVMKTPMRPAFTDKIAATPGYGIWKPKAGTSISRSELTQRSLFQCNFCRA
ncbi:hypothetical protein F5Y10DRAFT_264581 [Nemania abortiva]|nr:hypothetical protein F5Y10DRAFT_264581 [Nemania abortiva]